MGQEFNIISIDKCQFTPIDRLTVNLHNEVQFLPYMLVRPKKRSQIYNVQPNPLAAMPEELLLHIFEHLNVRSILCLSLTCARLWDIGWQHVQETILGTWRGTRIICEGDENDVCHLPSGLLSPSELDVFRAGITEADYEAAQVDDWDERIPGPSTLAVWMDVFGEEANTFFFGVPEVWNLFYSPTCSLPRDERDQAMYVLGSHNLEKAFCNQTWTLRNLTKKAFIRGQRLNSAFHPNSPSMGLDLPSPGFGEAIVSRITWSSSSTNSLGWNEGDWAGHRFEILTDEEHASVMDESWTDETEKVIQILAKGLELEVHAEKPKKRKRELSF